MLVGPPGSGKTMFLLAIHRHYKKESIFVDGTKASDAGILKKLFDSEPKYLLIDEIEKMNRQARNVLLNLLETGLVTSTLKNDRRTLKHICQPCLR